MSKPSACIDEWLQQLSDKFNALISFLVIALVVYFMVVVPMNRITERTCKQIEAGDPPAPTKEEVLLTEIRDLLRQQRS